MECHFSFSVWDFGILMLELLRIWCKLKCDVVPWIDPLLQKRRKDMHNRHVKTRVNLDKKNHGRHAIAEDNGTDNMQELSC